jgi:hypothetical protein
LNGFNKRFDNKKLNAPNAEEFLNDTSSVNTSSSHSHKSTSTRNQVNKEQEKFEIDVTLNKSRKRSASPKINYENFEPLVGAPRLNDKIAFQVYLSIFLNNLILDRVLRSFFIRS